MSQRPYWKDNLVTRTVEMNLAILDHTSLEDGLFYGDSFSITDGSGENIPYRLMSQHQKETAKAGRGIYAQFVVTKNPVNPCTISYVPRFTSSTEDNEFVQEAFAQVAGTDISRYSNNIDRVISEKVTPQKKADLAFGNFSNSNRIIDALNKLTNTIGAHYFDTTTLPNAIETAYLNTKDSYYSTLKAMRNLTLDVPNANTILMDSLRIMSRPPTGTLYGNYLFIAYRDETFTYKETPYKICRGDICLINEGELSIFYFGTDFSYKQKVVTATLAEINKLANNANDTLLTSSTVIDEAIDEYLKTTSGYFSDSVYFNPNLMDETLFGNHYGVIFAILGKDIDYQGETYYAGELVILDNGVPYRFGITAENVTYLEEKKAEYTNLLSETRSRNTSLTEAKVIMDVYGDATVPGKDNNGIMVEDGKLLVNGADILNSENTTFLRDSINAMLAPEYTNLEEIENLIPKVPTTSNNLESSQIAIELVNDLLEAATDGEMVILPLTKYLGNDTTINGDIVSNANECIIINDDEVYPLMSDKEHQVRYIHGGLYVFNSSKVFRIDRSTLTLHQVGLHSDSVMDIIDLAGHLTTVTQSGDYFHLINAEGDNRFYGEYVGHIVNTFGVVLNDDGVTTLLNVETGDSMNFPIDVTSTIPNQNDTLLLNDGVIVGTVSGGKVVPYIYESNDSWGSITVKYGYPYPTLSMDSHQTSFKVVTL